MSAAGISTPGVPQGSDQAFLATIASCEGDDLTSASKSKWLNCRNCYFFLTCIYSPPIFAAAAELPMFLQPTSVRKNAY